MTKRIVDEDSKTIVKFSGENYLILAVASLCALIVTFFTSTADFTFQKKATIFSAVVFFYLLVCFLIYISQKRQTLLETEKRNLFSRSISSPEMQAKLLALEEANQFFGSSLKTSDMFRLVSNRISEMIPFAACALFLANEDKYKIACAVGGNLKKFIGKEISLQKGLAGKTFQTKSPQTDKNLKLEKIVFEPEFLENLDSAIAVPLQRGETVFGVLTLYKTLEDDFDQNDLELLEAVGARVAALFSGSQAFDANLANALTDSLTKLPNERAFFLVLENQIAESQRFRDERPLTVLAMDIRNFNEFNQHYGHAVGDRLLVFAAENIKKELRQMDFLARAGNDEFLAVLPTASDTITLEIIERIEKTFVSSPFVILPEEKINIKLNFGAASFSRDGETASNLHKQAISGKRISKIKNKESNILIFPKDFVN